MTDKDKMMEEFEAWFKHRAFGFALPAHTKEIAKAGYEFAKESSRKELEAERNLCAGYIEKYIDYDKELEAAEYEIERLKAIDRRTADCLREQIKELEAAKRRIATLEKELANKK